MTPLATSGRIGPPLAFAFLLLSMWVGILAIPGGLLIAILWLTGVTAGHPLIGAGVLGTALVALFCWRHWLSGVTMAGGLGGAASGNRTNTARFTGEVACRGDTGCILP